MGRGAAPHRGATGLPLTLVLTLVLALPLPLTLALRSHLRYISQAERASCEIDQRTELSEAEFYRDYYLPARPVLLRGVMPLADRCKFAKAAPEMAEMLHESRGRRPNPRALTLTLTSPYLNPNPDPLTRSSRLLKLRRPA